MSSIGTEIRNLKKSPIFALSRGNNELSHTNFWAWLIEMENDNDKKHPFVEVFVPDFYDSEFKLVEVTREKEHMDLTIHYSDKEGNERCHVVENKIKAIPTAKQLKKYQDRLGEQFSAGTLTGIKKALDTDDIDGWSFKSYADIANDIEKILDDNKNNNYAIKDYSKIIQQYVKDIRCIKKIVDTSIKASGKNYVWRLSGELEEIKIADLTAKHLANDFGKEIENEIANNEDTLKSKKWGLPVVENSFNHKKPTITVIYKQIDNNNELGRFGIQIEGDQFRFYGGPSNSESKLKDKKKLYKEYMKNGWFENYNPSDKERTIMNKPSSMRKAFCKYETKEYTHIYQYWNIKENSKKSDICNEVIKQLERAKTIIDSKGLDYN